MVALAEAVHKSVVAQTIRCKVGSCVEGLIAEDAEAFNHAVQLIRNQRDVRGKNFNEGYTSSWLVGLVQAETGRRLGLQGVQRHISGNCVCELS
jgi:hypothetical protein